MNMETATEFCGSNDEFCHLVQYNAASPPDFAGKEILSGFEDENSDEPFRSFRYGCPCRRKQLECLQRAIMLITSKARMYGVSGKVIQL